MDDQTPDRSGSETVSRPPTLNDLARLGAELNRLGAHYVVVGGMAVIQAGYARITHDIDLLIETTLENEAKVFQALLILPDRAAAELKPGEVAQYGVVRVGDEVMVDLMKSGCGVTYAEAIQDAVHFEVEQVRIPFASPKILWRMKQTVRAKDIPDRLYLQRLLRAQGIHVELPSASPPPSADALSRFLRRTSGWWRK